MAANGRYVEPVNGRPGPIDPEKVREDPALLVAAIARAVEFVEKQDPQHGIYCFGLNNKVYDVNICPCFHPTIICRAISEENPHRPTSSRNTNDMVDDFMTEMGTSNFLIMNALRKQKEDKEAAQRVTPEAAEQGAKGELPPPSSSKNPAINRNG
jgi:hypothetical protein